jgi:hypothetical protein
LYWRGSAQRLLLPALPKGEPGAQHFYRKLGYKDCGGFVPDVPGYEQPMELFLVKGI